MMKARFALALFALLSTAAASAQTLAPTPPMGWNSWDAYGFTIDEADFKANAAVLAGFKEYGWSYAVIDEGWYMANPLGDKLETRQYQFDGHGRLMPDVHRFPSAAGGAGLKPLADWVHGQGLKFGIHILRGIPKQAVRDNASIEGSAFRAADAADTSDTCPWDEGNFGVRDSAAGQAYYDSEMRLFAEWGVDFIKVDCIADHPYKGVEIRQIADAVGKTGRPIVLSLSPGPTQLSHADEIARYAQMWRIGDDTWDGWTFPHNDPKSEWPLGVRDGFDKLALWTSHARPGNWPDADMLPFGSLTPHPGWGEPRQSRLTQDEARTMFTLWAIARSPLILGGNLTKLDDFTRSLITNKELIAVNQTAWDSHPVKWECDEYTCAWEALAGPRDKPIKYHAVFNLTELGTLEHIPFPVQHKYISLWDGKNYVVEVSSGKFLVDFGLNPHDSAIFRLE